MEPLPATENDAAPETSRADAGSDAGCETEIDATTHAACGASLGDASVYEGPPCCQVLNDGSACQFGCYPDAASDQLPWLCDVKKPTTCGSPRCGLGSTCQAVGGTRLHPFPAAR